MVVCEGCGAVCACSGRELQIINLPVNHKKKRSGYQDEKLGERLVFVEIT